MRRRRRPARRGAPGVRRSIMVTNQAYIPSPRTFSLIPSTRRVTLRYAIEDYGSVSIAAGDNFAVFNFRGNSVFDPEEAVGGHQPRGYDQLTALYSHYKVLSSAINITYSNSANLTTRPIMGIIAQPASAATLAKRPYWGITPPELASTIGTPPELQEVPRAKVVQTQWPVTNGIFTLKSKAKTSTILNTRITDKSDLAAASTTNPAAQWYWSIIFGLYTGAPAGTTNLGGFTGYLEYDVVFSDPVHASSS